MPAIDRSKVVVYVQLRVKYGPKMRVQHVKGGNLIFEKLLPEEVYRIIEKAAAEHYKRIG